MAISRLKQFALPLPIFQLSLWKNSTGQNGWCIFKQSHSIKTYTRLKYISKSPVMDFQAKMKTSLLCKKMGKYFASIFVRKFFNTVSHYASMKPYLSSVGDSHYIACITWKCPCNVYHYFPTAILLLASPEDVHVMFITNSVIIYSENRVVQGSKLLGGFSEFCCS